MEVLEAVGGEPPCTRSHWPLLQLASRLATRPANLVKPVSLKGCDLSLGTCLPQKAGRERPNPGRTCEKRRQTQLSPFKKVDGKTQQETPHFWSCCFVCAPNCCTWTLANLQMLE